MVQASKDTKEIELQGSKIFPYGDSNLIVVLQVDLLKNKLGFDEAFNYKEEPDLDTALKRLGT